MNMEDFAADLAAMCSRSPIAPGRPLAWTIIANPKAGGFTIRSRWNKHRRILKSYAEEARRNPPRQFAATPSRTAQEADRSSTGGSIAGGNTAGGCDQTGPLGALGLVPTLRRAHAGEIVRALIDEAMAAQADQASGPQAGQAAARQASAGAALQTTAAEQSQAGAAQRKAPFYLIICAGGDGTSLEALTALYYAPPALRSSLAILRLPMGTGNDGADARELDQALELLVHPTRVEYVKAVRLRTATQGVGPFLAFNILSLGLDAFVTHMTNKMKGSLPGDSYKLWVDIATLFYDSIYTVAPMTVRAMDSGARAVQAFQEELLLIAFGASGNRSYGANKPILPDGRNVCAVKKIPIIKRLALKKLFTTGRHADLPEARLFNAQRVEIDYAYPILAQMDGESVRLEAKDFPVSIELTEPAIPILKRA